MEEEHLTHKELELDLKEIKNKLANLQNQINKSNQKFLAHIEGDSISLR